jgi:hypothetical protein
MIDLNDIWINAIRNKVTEILFPYLVEIKAMGGSFEITDNLEFKHTDISYEMMDLIHETLKAKMPMIKWDDDDE